VLNFTDDAVYPQQQAVEAQSGRAFSSSALLRINGPPACDLWRPPDGDVRWCASPEQATAE